MGLGRTLGEVSDCRGLDNDVRSLPSSVSHCEPSPFCVGANVPPSDSWDKGTLICFSRVDRAPFIHPLSFILILS
jgi:hypothetical protein